MAQEHTGGKAAKRRSAPKAGERRAGEARSFAPKAPGNRATGHIIQTEIQRLAMNPKLSYEAIASKVRERVQGAQTSSKSVASVIHDLRASGVEVPGRNPPAGRPRPAPSA
jgi:hypothetical protein